MTTHHILWEDDGAIGYRCSGDRPGAHTGSVHGVNEGDKVIECPTCGLRLKATWHVTLEPTSDPVTPD